MKPASSKIPAAPVSLRSQVLTALIAFAGCLVVPAAVSLVLGMSRLTLTRQDNTVTATVQHLIFFGIPWKTESLSSITRVDHAIIQGERLKRKTGESTRRKRYAMDNGELILTSPSGRLTVAADPSMLRVTEAETKVFLAEPSRHSHRQFLMANRLFGWLFGIPVTLLALLYVTGATLACLRGLRRLMGMGNPSRRPGKGPAGPASA